MSIVPEEHPAGQVPLDGHHRARHTCGNDAYTRPHVDPIAHVATTSVSISLTQRERILVAMLASGLTDASAATRLHVSPRTVTNVLRTLMNRLGVNNRFQLGLAIGAQAAYQHFTDVVRPDMARPRSHSVSHDDRR